MTILKSISLTVILILVFLFAQIGFALLFDIISTSEDFRSHYGITIIFSTLISYFTVLHFFCKPKLTFIIRHENIKINFRIILFLCLTALGLKLLTRPFLDSSEIFDYYLNAEFNPNYYIFTGIDSNLIYTHFGALLIAPILEELLFRRYIFKRLLKNYSLITAMVVSSSLFALPHLPAYENLIPAFIFGLVTCIIYYKTNKIIYSIIFHFSYNFLALLLDIYGKTIYQKMYGLEFNFTYWSIFITGVLITYLGLQKINEAKTL